MPPLGGRRAVVILLVLLSWGIGGAGAEEAGSNLVPEVSDLDEALAELEAGGSPLTSEETAGLLKGGWALGKGTLRWRRGLSDSCPGPGTFSADLSWRRMELRVRRGREGCAPGPWYGSLSVETTWSSLWAGDVGISQGHGLLAGRPGRLSGGNADQSLQPGRAGLRAWPHEPSGGALRGIAGSMAVGAARMEFLAGVANAGAAAADPTYGLVRLSAGGSGDRPGVSALLLRDPAGQAGSAAFAWAGSRLSGSLEGVARLGGRPSRGFSGTLVLRMNPRCRFEGAVGWVRGGEPSALAVRPPWLVGWEGGGWSLRVAATLLPGFTVQALISSCATDLDAGAGARSRTRWDFLLSHRTASGWRGQLRWRRQGQREALRSSRWSWLPPQEGPVETATTVTATLGRNYSRGFVHLGLRTRQVAGSDRDGARYLFTVGGDCAPGPEWTLRCQWDLAWGDPVDLVSALSPLQGYVLPRHWSRWQEQVMVGVGREFGPWRFQAGTAGRDPAPSGAGLNRSWEVWVEAAVTW